MILPLHGLQIKVPSASMSRWGLLLCLQGSLRVY
jgi:hypothetical protein